MPHWAVAAAMLRLEMVDEFGGSGGPNPCLSLIPNLGVDEFAGRSPGHAPEPPRRGTSRCLASMLSFFMPQRAGVNSC